MQVLQMRERAGTWIFGCVESYWRMRGGGWRIQGERIWGNQGEGRNGQGSRESEVRIIVTRRQDIHFLSFMLEFTATSLLPTPPPDSKYK